ncbi:hypothetical protein BHE74_00014090 [Ensete ventricosum]|uniref:Uncharacterized protein n=1 Tax=Ensete ventricosum TaxID=4639 RepID=A0A445MG10_ENSVE|nr:hypothetical protein BHE74_00014090 [Ensete ventricosum]RZR73202.1 hypothetical protein BHM03_00021414 [Ensete ventricosum]
MSIPVRDLRFACTLRKSDDDTSVLRKIKGKRQGSSHRAATAAANQHHYNGRTLWRVASGFDEDEGIGGLFYFSSLSASTRSRERRRRDGDPERRATGSNCSVMSRLQKMRCCLDDRVQSEERNLKHKTQN